MNKEKLGNFIGDERKALGLTQKDLAARLHVTDKAVSKWERGLSYPDVTLLEPLAAALDLGVEELMACRRQAVREEKEEDESMKNLLAISGDNLRAERSQSRRKLTVLAVLAVLLLAAVSGLVWFCLETFASAQAQTTIELKETVDGVDYIYVEQDGQLLRLKYGEGIDFDELTLKDEGGYPWVFRLDYQWNRKTRQGIVKSCDVTGISVIGSTGSMVGSMLGLDNVPGTDDQLFGYPCVFCEYTNVYQNPYGREEVYSFRVWSCDPETWEKERFLLKVNDCFGFTQEDYDHDGVTELVIRTRWEMKPYIVYDMVDGEVVETWLDTVEPDLAERLLTADERQERLDKR